MSLNSALSIASSGLQVAQAGLKVTSDNVANVNTPGYVRKVADQQSVYVAGQGGLGVSISQIRTAADTFLEAASRLASADAGSAQATSDTLDQAQQLFGDPNGTTGFFSQLNTTFQRFIALAAAPSSSTRAAAVPQAQALFDQASDIGAQLGDLRSQATSRIGADVDTVNGLLTQIDGLNADISRATALGQDASGAQDQQSQALDRLAALLPVQVDRRSGGGVVVRSPDGVTLAGAGGAAKLSYDGSGVDGRFTATSASGVAFALTTPSSGEIGGLAKLRDTTLPAMTAQLSELVGGTAAALNAVHNQFTAVPPPVSMTGRATGLDADAALAHFSGQETLAVTDKTGAPVTAAVIDFDAKTVSVNGGVVGSFTDAASFTSTLNTALNGAATVDFTKSPATITSSDTTPASAKRLVLAGGALQADGAIAGTAAAKAGQGFSAWFGLNDLVGSSGLSSFSTGLQPADASGYATGAIGLRLTAPDGSVVRDVSVAMPAGNGSMQALTTALNTSVQPYGSFSLDSTGALAFTPSASSGAAVQVAADTTTRNGSGPSISTLFGIGDASRSARLGQLAVRPDIQGDPSRLALAKWDPSKTPPLSASDGAGADALAQAANTPIAFGAAGGASATTASLSNYAAAFGAATARAASAADDAATSAASVKTEADTRRSSVEGVNMDQELINMTTYQQAYSASARMIQAVKDMYDALLNMV